MEPNMYIHFISNKDSVALEKCDIHIEHRLGGKNESLPHTIYKNECDIQITDLNVKVKKNQASQGKYRKISPSS